MRPLVIVSDVHLGHRQCRPIACALARLVTRHAGHEIVLNGDTFNLSCDPWDRDPAASAAAMLADHPCLRSAFERHLAGGDRLTIIAGNHDMAISGNGVRAALLALLIPGADADLRIEPWIVRRGQVHVEHGHLYDPANSPTHPLALPSFRTEPVGVGLTRRFVGPYDAWDLLAEHWTAKAGGGLRLMFDCFGARAPVAVLRYVALLITINAEIAVTSRLSGERQRGEAALSAYAARVDLTDASLRALIDGRPQPLHFSFRHTLRRLALDAALAGLVIPAGMLAAAVTGRVEALAASLTAFAYLAATRKHRADRQANHMPDALRSGAALVRRFTDARLVVFGHSHCEDEMDGYLNLGAFGDPPPGARTFVHIDEQGRVERRRLEA